eukprot:scaffold56164_cov61-Phaeocystis_antarctica.AAC.3
MCSGDSTGVRRRCPRTSRWYLTGTVYYRYIDQGWSPRCTRRCSLQLRLLSLDDTRFGPLDRELRSIRGCRDTRDPCNFNTLQIGAKSFAWGTPRLRHPSLRHPRRHHVSNLISHTRLASSPPPPLAGPAVPAHSLAALTCALTRAEQEHHVSAHLRPSDAQGVDPRHRHADSRLR